MPSHMKSPKTDSCRNCKGAGCYECKDPMLGLAKGGEVNPESGETGHEKGVHTATDKPGHSFAGAMQRSETSVPRSERDKWAKESHHKVLGEMRSMPKPHGNYAEGGSVLGSAIGDSLEKMHSEPKRKPSLAGPPGSTTDGQGNTYDSQGNKITMAEGGEVEDHEASESPEEGDMEGMLGDELMEAVHRKDKKAVWECLEACILHLMSKES